jgi:hypothetical protein
MIFDYVQYACEHDTAYGFNHKENMGICQFPEIMEERGHLARLTKSNK